MAGEWFTGSDLRETAGAKQAAGQDGFDRVAAVARGKVRKLCGPVNPAENITERVRVRVARDSVALKYRPASLTSISYYASGATLSVSDFDFDGQSLFRKDGGLIGQDLSVTYSTGWDDQTEIPVELLEMARIIGHQTVRIERRFKVDQNAANNDLTGTSYQVPSAALEVGAEYLLAPEGFA